MSYRKRISIEDFEAVPSNIPVPMPSGAPITHVLNDRGGVLDGCVDFGDDGSNIPSTDEMFADPKVGEFPDLNPDTKLIAAVDASLEAMAEVIADVRRAGGMSFDIALECQRVIPEFSIPLNRFTKHPTKTQYNASMESMLDTIAAAAVRVMKTIRNAIMRMFYWIIGEEYKPKDPHTSDNANINEIEEIPVDVLARVEARMEEYNGAIVEAKRVLGDIHFQMNNFEGLIANAGIEYRDANNNLEWYRDPAKYIKDMNYANGTDTEQKIYEFMTEGDRIHNDLSGGGSFVQMFTNVEKLMDEAASHSSQVMTAYTRLDVNNVGALEEVLQKGETIGERAKEIENDAMNREFTKSTVGTKKLSDLMRPYDRIDVLTGAGFGKCVALVKSLGTFNSITKQIKQIENQFSSSQPDHQKTEEYRKIVQVSNQAGRDSLNLIKVIAAFFRLVTESSRSGRNFSNTLSYLVNRIANNSLPGKGEESLEKLKRIQELAKIIRQDLTTYAVKMGTIMNA